MPRDNFNEGQEPSIDRVLSRLLSAEDGERSAAVEELRSRGSALVDTLLTIVASERTEREHRIHRLTAFRRTWTVLCLAALALPWLPAKLGVLLVLLPLGILGLNGRMDASDRQKGATLGLAYFDDSRAVGPLASRLALGPSHQDRDSALIRLLPRLTQEEAQLLNREQRQNLYDTLGQSNGDLALAVLSALPVIDDGGALPIVRKVASGKVPQFTDQRTRLVAAANEAIPVLERLAAARSRPPVQPLGRRLLHGAERLLDDGPEWVGGLLAYAGCLAMMPLFFLTAFLSGDFRKPRQGGDAA